MGSGRKSTALTTLKIAVFKPIPRTRAATTKDVVAGRLRISRKLKRTSCIRGFMRSRFSRRLGQSKEWAASESGYLGVKSECFSEADLKSLLTLWQVKRAWDVSVSAVEETEPSKY